MKPSKHPLCLFVVLMVVASFGISGVSAGWDSPFKLSLATTGLPEAAADFASDTYQISLAKPKRHKSKNWRNRGTTYKKPNYKIKAPQMSEADRLKKDGALLDYLDGSGLSPQSPMGANPSAAKNSKKAPDKHKKPHKK